MASPDHNSLREKAAECFLALEVGSTDRLTRLRWRAWLAESAEHRRAVEDCRRTWIASAAATIQMPGNTELSQDRYDGGIPVAGIRAHRLVPHWSAEPLARPRIPRSAWMGIAASLALAAVITFHYRPVPRQTPTPVVYETGRGQQQQLTLPDGSVVMLGPEVRLEVRFEPSQRVFRLIRGEAIFTAAHDPARPFLVYAGQGWIEDIGTAFDVRSDPDRVTVTVIQGQVEVGTPGAGDQGKLILSRDQQISFGAATSAVQTVDATQATAWRGGQIAYIDQPLEKVVSDLRRYSMKDIVLQDPSVGALHYTGTVSVSELDHWAAGLTRVYPVQIEVAGDRLLIGPRRKDR
ncbi:MAG TPA: FecR domain-containing protein [Alphaproteobacteria bacterium]|jgi:transmembrane sensor|nr:FecR domain-containing protein [Alphaproteobacteria bacterium]